MNSSYFSRNTAGLCVVFSTLLLMPASAAHADSQNMPIPPVPHTVSLRSVSSTQPQVIVKIGEAMLEEYRHGDPANRVQLLRGSLAAQTADAVLPAKSRS